MALDKDLLLAYFRLRLGVSGPQPWPTPAKAALRMARRVVRVAGMQRLGHVFHPVPELGERAILWRRYGLAEYGEFADEPQPGAVRCCHGRWFIPAVSAPEWFSSYLTRKMGRRLSWDAA